MGKLIGAPLSDEWPPLIDLLVVGAGGKGKKGGGGAGEVIYLTDFSIPTSETTTEVFSLKPITYICGGFLGDFIQSLSVICENFYETGRKGILYISNHREAFKYSIEDTYNDLYPVIIRQKYVQHFKIYNNESNKINFD
jgi:hypothetical protein